MNAAIALNILADSMDKYARALEGKESNRGCPEAFELSCETAECAYAQVNENFRRVCLECPMFLGMEMVFAPTPKGYRTAAIETREYALGLSI